MATIASMSEAEHPRARVEATVNGPYLVTGGAPLARCRPLRPAHGEPGWESTTLRTGEVYTLCRCGGSARKPFCDGTHRRIGFDGTGPEGAEATRTRVDGAGPADRAPGNADPTSTHPSSASTLRPEPAPEDEGLPPGIGVIDDGPLVLTGVALRRADGSTVSRSGMRLCRCGRSADKPFCDDSHQAAGFQDPGPGS